jgi:hypothetical protein
MLRTNFFASIVILSLCCSTTQTYCMDDFIEKINDFIIDQIPSSPYITLIIGSLFFASTCLNILFKIRETNIEKLYIEDLETYGKYKVTIVNWNKNHPNDPIKIEDHNFE